MVMALFVSPICSNVLLPSTTTTTNTTRLCTESDWFDKQQLHFYGYDDCNRLGIWTQNTIHIVILQSYSFNFHLVICAYYFICRFHFDGVQEKKIRQINIDFLLLFEWGSALQDILSGLRALQRRLVSQIGSGELYSCIFRFWL